MSSGSSGRSIEIRRSASLRAWFCATWDAARSGAHASTRSSPGVERPRTRLAALPAVVHPARHDTLRRPLLKRSTRPACRAGRRCPSLGMRTGRRPRPMLAELSWLLGSWSGHAASSYERPFVSSAEVAMDPARVRCPWYLVKRYRRPCFTLDGGFRSAMTRRMAMPQSLSPALPGTAARGSLASPSLRPRRV
jgi:hypothetical protein